MEKEIEKLLKHQKFDESKAKIWTNTLNKNIKQFLKNCEWKRYKYIVQVFIGENKGQGIELGTKQLWDQNNDNISYANYINESLYCICIAYAIYVY